MDNITESWLPQDIDTSKAGAHNGDNYIAYTFYIANEGKEITNYWYQINILDVIKNVDDAVRIKVYEMVFQHYMPKQAVKREKQNQILFLLNLKM